MLWLFDTLTLLNVTTQQYLCVCVGVCPAGEIPASPRPPDKKERKRKSTFDLWLAVQLTAVTWVLRLIRQSHLHSAAHPDQWLTTHLLRVGAVCQQE